MKRSIVFAALLATASAITASPKKAADLFGSQLDCATRKALNAYDPARSETNRVRRAVDSCMANSMSQERGIVRVSTNAALSANATMSVLEERRENLVDAVMRRLQLCRDTGVRAATFASACPQLFTLERE